MATHSPENVVDSTNKPNTTPCHLLALPTELQLTIYTHAVQSPSPHLLNCPCDSSYRPPRYDRLVNQRLRQQHHLDIEAWKTGELHPPTQPALTQTCRTIRSLSLPLFYGLNVFRATYCQRWADFGPPVRWLRAMGRENREMLRHLYFYDRRADYDDARRGEDLSLLRETEIFVEMGAEMEKLSSEWCCAHLVTFGERRERGVNERPLALEPEVPRLRIEHERGVPGK